MGLLEQVGVAELTLRRRVARADIGRVVRDRRLVVTAVAVDTPQLEVGLAVVTFSSLHTSSSRASQQTR